MKRLCLFALVLTILLPAAAAAQEPEKKQELPTGHPQVATPPSDASPLPPVPEGSGTGELGLAWDVPAAWTPETPSSSMRRAQYRVPGEAGDGECVVYYFGPGQGGPPEANIERWANQLVQDDGRPGIEVAKVAELDVGGIAVSTVEVTGTYSGGMTMRGPALAAKPGYMLLGAVAEGPDSNWFFKLTGPEATLAPQREAFAAMLRSIRQGE